MGLLSHFQPSNLLNLLTLSTLLVTKVLWFNDMTFKWSLHSEKLCVWIVSKRFFATHLTVAEKAWEGVSEFHALFELI
jgi:hypothetical protein